jgi:hypothetical protein
MRRIAYASIGGEVYYIGKTRLRRFFGACRRIRRQKARLLPAAQQFDAGIGSANRKPAIDQACCVRDASINRTTSVTNRTGDCTA